MDYSDSSEDEFSDIGSGSDVESEEEVESEVSVSSASSGNEGENDEEMEVDDEEEANEEILRSKNGMEWSIDPPHFRQTPRHNIVKQRRGLPVFMRDNQNPLEVFNKFFTQPMKEMCITCTNNKGHIELGDEWVEIDAIEFDAFLGILVLLGVFKSKNESLDEKWNKVNGQPHFRATMSLKRFKNIVQFLRFDDIRTREERRRTDKLAPIRNLWTLLQIELCKNYLPGDSLTIDEQMVGTRGKCPIKQYIHGKPDKYAVKTFWVNDAETFYPLQGEIYVGQQPNETKDQSKERNKPSNLVYRLSRPWHNKGFSVTGDRYFTSTDLATSLITAQTGYVGTINANRREVPNEMKPNRAREVHSSKFCFNNLLTLVSYVPKKNKATILLSTVHHDNNIDEDPPHLPDIIHFYNATKSGTDCMNKMVKAYSAKRKINRWPVTVFFNIVDVSCYASYVVWCEDKPRWKENKKYKRRIFQKELGIDLIKPHMERRSQNPHVVKHKSVKNAMLMLDVTPQLVPQQREALATKKRCGFCNRDTDRKTITVCGMCETPVCKEHSYIVCRDCMDVVEEEEDE